MTVWDLTADPGVAALLASEPGGRATTDRLTSACAAVVLGALVDVQELPVVVPAAGDDLRRLPANVASGTAWDVAVSVPGPHDGPDVIWFGGDALHVLDVVAGPWPAAPVTDPDTGLVVPADAPDALHARGRALVLAAADDDRASIGLAVLEALRRWPVHEHTARLRASSDRVLVEVSTVVDGAA